jgi:parvulin-like peptidyl-prolyl isomerase
MDRRTTQRKIVRAVAVASGLLLAGGCSTAPTAAPMTSAVFMPANASTVQDWGWIRTVPKAPVTDDSAPSGSPVASQSSTPKAVILPPAAPLTGVKPLPPLQAVDAAYVETPHLEGARPDAAPATEASKPDPVDGPAAGSGVYMALGGVVAKVSDTPIYASQILSVLDKEFTARSRDMSADEFKHFARIEILKQLKELIEDEKDFQMAYRGLSPDDRKLARAESEEMRHERLRDAAGVEQLARRKAADDGAEFDDQCNQTYRMIVNDLFRKRQIEPMIQVTADDMREFYRQNLTKLYTQKEQIQFRVIEISPDVIGGDQPDRYALDKVTALRAKAARGDDFASLASSENDDPYLRSTGGDVGGWKDRNAFREQAVDEAVWKLDAGQVTDVIKSDGNYYIACVEQKKTGHVRPFEDEAVQDEIYARLYRQQGLAQMMRLQNEADDDAIVKLTQSSLDTAVDMAMQKYARR